MKKATTKPKITAQEKLTNLVIEIIENGLTENNGQINWDSIDLRGQHNHQGNRYNIINSTILSKESKGCGYTNTQWLTFKQSNALGGDLKGKKSTSIVLAFPIFEKDKKGNFVLDKDGQKIIDTFRYSGVALFNIQQTGLDEDPQYSFDREARKLNNVELGELSIDFIEAFQKKVPIDFGGVDTASYKPTLNRISMPHQFLFHDEAHFQSTLFHEASHSTGHQDWLNRDGIVKFDKFGSVQYAKEELIAELSSAMICSELNIDYKLEFHASYLENWIQVLKNDTKYIGKASSEAGKACDAVLEFIKRS